MGSQESETTEQLNHQHMVTLQKVGDFTTCPSTNDIILHTDT